MARRRGFGGHGGKGPGSRGGHPWTDAHGNVRYGPQPHQVLPRGTGKLRAFVNSGPKANHVLRVRALKTDKKFQAKKKMLAELDTVFKTGKDPHGNKLDAKTLSQVNFLATALRTELHGNG
jgi:hypothetical protein